MNARRALEPFVDLTVRCLDPDAVFLFGSVARGEMRVDSDVDVLVIGRFAEPKAQRAAELRGLLAELPIAIDLLLYTPEEFEAEARTTFSLADVVRRHGVCLYERSGGQDNGGSSPIVFTR